MGDVQVHDPTSDKKDKDYAESDVKHVMHLQDWKSWDEIASWLRKEGDADNELTPGEARHMADDFDRLADKGTEFTTDYKKAFDAAKSSR